MYRLRCAFVLLMFPLLAGSPQAQETQSTPTTPTEAAAPDKDVDPLALKVFEAVAQPVEQAKSFSFKALVSEEELATDGQIVTFFHKVDVTVQRPDKVHLIFRGRGQTVEFFTANGSTIMYAPDAKLYTTLPAKNTIDAIIADASARGIDMPVGPFLRTDLYDMVAKAVITGYVIGRVKIYDQDVHQLVFTAPDDDFQVWVTGGETPRFIRAEVVNKDLEGKPRTVIQFLDWDLNPTIAADEFTFTKPADAHEISMLPGMGGK
jgi:hypothetical protein